MLRLGFLLLLASIAGSGALRAQARPGGGPGGAGAAQLAAAAATQGAGGGGGGGSASSVMVLDAANNSLIIRTTPRNHRRIADLIRKVSSGKLGGEKQETRIFNVRAMSPEQLFRILEFQRPTFQRSSTLVFPETMDGQALGGIVR
ncbi:MAG: hypothetical protein HY303_09250 [Candidatus Wallbacteria bacterium]|nr:hypothetical protein [Candidatus Wallbacteria bacterium]